MNKNNVQPSQSIPLFRRKRSYLFILLSLLLLALYLRIPSSSAPFSNNPQRQTKNLIHAKGPLRKPTAALEKLALQQGVLRPIDPNGKDLIQGKENTQFISTTENLYLLFGALKKKDWNLNEGDYGIIQPKDQKEMVKALGKLGLDKKLVSCSSDRQRTCFECTSGEIPQAAIASRSNESLEEVKRRERGLVAKNRNLSLSLPLSSEISFPRDFEELSIDMKTLSDASTQSSPSLPSPLDSLLLIIHLPS